MPFRARQHEWISDMSDPDGARSGLEVPMLRGRPTAMGLGPPNAEQVRRDVNEGICGGKVGALFSTGQ